MITSRKFLLISVAIVLISALIALTYSQEVSTQATQDDREEFERLAEVYQTINENYFTDLSVKDAFSGALNGMLNQLDPHSIFVDFEDARRMEEEYQGNYEGIGVSFVMLDDKITVMEVFSGGPSDQVGMRMGDQIVEIEGESAIGMDSDEVQLRLRGPRGTRVSVKVQRREGTDSVPYVITRGRIPIRSIENALMLGPGMAYIRINRFAHPTANELERALVKLDDQGMERLILDLRGNTGGLLNAAIGVADKFLSGRRLIVYTQGRTEGSDYSLYSNPNSRNWDLPLVILIDHVSASASEIVAGALQDWDRALVVGQTSFGKGLVQTGFRLEDRSHLLLTTARYYTPTGRLIQRNYKGIDLETYQMQGLDDYDPQDVDIEVSDGLSPTYLTAAGREVYGGGGIKPDMTIEGEPMFDRFVYYLNYRLMTFLYGRDYFWKHADMNLDFESFNRDFTVTDQMLEGMLALAKEREFVFYPRRGHALSDEQMEKRFWELADDLRIFIKAEIAQFYFGRSAGYLIRRMAKDNQIAEAQKLFNEAEELAVMHQGIDPGVFVKQGGSGGDNE